jgi:hypothetical protein
VHIVKAEYDLQKAGKELEIGVGNWCHGTVTSVIGNWGLKVGSAGGGGGGAAAGA